MNSCCFRFHRYYSYLALFLLFVQRTLSFFLESMEFTQRCWIHLYGAIKLMAVAFFCNQFNN